MKNKHTPMPEKNKWLKDFGIECDLAECGMTCGKGCPQWNNYIFCPAIKKLNELRGNVSDLISRVTEG